MRSFLRQVPSLTPLAPVLTRPLLPGGQTEPAQPPPLIPGASFLVRASHRRFPPSLPRVLGLDLWQRLMLPLTLAAACCRASWRWRRVTALVLVLMLGSFALALAIHAVHHLDDPRQGTVCVVFSVSQHVAGILAEPLDLGIFSPGPETPPSAASHASLPHLFCRPDQPRAPPIVPA